MTRTRQPTPGASRLRRGLRWLGGLGVVLVATLVVAAPEPAAAAPFDCKDSPVPDMPGTGLAGFFSPRPEELPPAEDPFAEDATTSVYEQYGLAGLRWNTFDLGCGPDAARNPDAVVGTAISNWLMNVPLCLAAVAASITEAAFAPSFLDAFDPLLTEVSSKLYDGLFANWAPVVLAAVGILLLVKARGQALASTAGAVGWAVLVVLVTTALFRWPVESGRVADATVTGSLATVVDGLNGSKTQDAGQAVAGGLQSSILYTAWLAGELGSTRSETAKEYGPELFKAQTLSWREAALVQSDPEAGKDLIEKKKDRFEQIAGEIEDQDPTAYEHLTGKRSDNRVGYALLATIAMVLALPFLLVAALMLLGSFLVIRLAVMVFPLIATLGLFPSARGLVLGVGRTVGAALVNAVVFGVGAAVTVVVFGVILDPDMGLPAWLVLVLLGVFSLIMWVLLKPFRRLTSMAPMSKNAFGDAASLGHVGSKVKAVAGKVVRSAASVTVAGVGGAAALAQGALKDRRRAEEATDQEPVDDLKAERVEARRVAENLPALSTPTRLVARALPPGPHTGPDGSGWRRFRRSSEGTTGVRMPAAGLGEPAAESRSLPVTEPDRVDGEEVYPIYRPTPRAASDDRDPADLAGRSV